MGCTIVRTRHGRLAYRLRGNGLPGDKYERQEATGLKDTEANRTKLQKRADVIAEEMDAGTFDFARWFGQSPATEPPSTAPRVPAFCEYVEQQWLPEKQPPLVRVSCRRDYLKHWNAHIKPAWGDVLLTDLTVEGLKAFRRALLAKGLKLKTVRNIIGGTFQKLYRDARAAKLVTDDPFAALDWPRRVRVAPDPFTRDERDLLLDYFRERRPGYHAFVLTAFATGMRPSELCGLRWGDVDLRTGQLDVRRSRTCHEDHPTKTEGSERTVRLPSAVVDALKRLRRMHVDPDAFVFRNLQGDPIHGESFTKHEWAGALRATGVRARKFYATRATYISTMLSGGAKAKRVAEETGTSLAMIERHYGRYMPSAADDLDDVLGLGTTSGTVPEKSGSRRARAGRSGA
jgi:integrase